MSFLIALIFINILSVVSLLMVLVSCGKKENENNNNGSIQASATKAQSPKISKTENSQISKNSQLSEIRKSSDIYHEVAENLAFPASSRCKNHDDAWRILALYLDYIRVVNPKEFEQFRLLDSALAVLHDFSFVGRPSHCSSETLALAVLYFLVDFHKIRVNLGSASSPWYSILCKSAKREQLETMKAWMEQDLIGTRSSSEETTMKEAGDLKIF